MKGKKMSNMGYCRFRNTLTDLRDCYDNLGETESEEEADAEVMLIKLCKQIAEEMA